MNYADESLKKHFEWRGKSGDRKRNFEKYYFLYKNVKGTHVYLLPDLR